MDEIESNYWLEEFDLDILRLHSSKQRDDGNVKPIWSLNNWNLRNKEYYEFEVLAERTGLVDEKDVDFDDVSSQTCHICNVNIPNTFVKQHNKSFKHVTCMKIADQALERIKKHMSQDVEDLPKIKTTTASYFCDPCAVVVRVNDKTDHETSEHHLKSLAHDKLLNNLLLTYLNKDNVLIKINKSTMTTAEAEQDNDQTSETLPLLDPNVLICNKLSLKANGMYYCNACNIHLIDRTVLHHVSKDSHKYNLTFKSKHADSNTNASCKVEGPKTSVKNDSIHYLMEYKGKINELLCKVCKVIVPNHIDNVNGHIRGSKHVKKYITMLASHQLTGRGAKYFCTCCLKYVDYTIVIDHINCFTHKNNLLKVTDNSKTGVKHEANSSNSKIVVKTESNSLCSSIQSAVPFVSLHSEAKTEHNVDSKTMADLEPKNANSKTTPKLESNSVHSNMIAKTDTSSVNSEIFAEIKPNTVNSETIAKLEQNSINSTIVANIESNSGNSKTTFKVLKSCDRSESNVNSIDEEDDGESFWHACKICNVFLANNDSIIKSHYEGDSHKSRLEVTFMKKPKEILKKIHHHMQFTDNLNLLMCKICNITVEFNSIKVSGHRKSFDHKLKLISLLEENTIKKIKKMFFCQSCNTSFKKKYELIHIESLIHKHKLNSTKLSECDDAFTSKSFHTKMTIESDIVLNRNIDLELGMTSDAIVKPENNLISQLTNHPTSNVTKNESDMSKKHDSNKYTEPPSSTAFEDIASKAVTKYNTELNNMMFKIAKRKNDESDGQTNATDFHYLIEKIPNSNQLMCKLCNVIVGHYTESVTIHIEGSKHKSKYNQMLKLNKLDKIDDHFYGCEVCKECVTEGEEFDHINDYNHKTCLSLFTGTEVAGGHFVKEITENQKELMCRACQVLIPKRITNLKTHLKSEKHISNYNSTLDANRLKKYINSFYCELCSISVNEVNIFDHINGDSHKCKITKIMPKDNISTSLTTEVKLNKSVSQIKFMDEIDKSFDNISSKNILKDILTESPGSSGLNKVEYSKNNNVSKPNSADRLTTKVTTLYYQIENTNNPKEVTCKVCKVIIPNTTVNITTHIGGLKHNSNYVSLLDANELTKKNDKDILCCEICWVEFKGSGLFDHIYSDIHEKRMSVKTSKASKNSENQVSDHNSAMRKNETSHGNTKVNEITKNKAETEDVRKSKRDFSYNLLLETNEIEKYSDDLFDCKCKICGRFFFTAKDVFNHIYSDIHKKNIKQKIANKIVGNSILDANGVTKYSNTLFDCEICNSLFFTNKVLLVHIYSEGHKSKIMQIAKVG